MKILNYKILDLRKEFTIEMPLDARILDVKIVGESIYLYVLADIEQKKVERRFLPAVVGQPLDDQLNLKYINFLAKGNWLQPCLIFEIV